MGRATLFDESVVGMRPVAELEPLIEFTVRGNPIPKGSLRAFMPRRKVGDRLVPTGHPVVVADNAKSLTPWLSAVKSAASTVMGDRDVLRGPVGLIVTFVLSRPRSHYGARGLLPSAPAYPVVKPDWDKLARGICDAMTGVVYADDNQIVTVALRKIYGETPGVRVGVTHPADQLLSFDWDVR